MNIVIAGASRGIGLAEAKLFDRPENRLFLISRDADSFEHNFQHATIIGADLATSAGVYSAVQAVGRHTKSIDVLINNVGIMIMKPFQDLSEADFDQLLNTNLRSHLLLTSQFLPLLHSAERPQIVFMSSMAAKSFIIGESVYSATKAGVSAFANVLRNELSGRVRVSTVHAWGVNTWGAAEPSGLMQPRDVAEAVEYIITRPDTAVVESIDLGNPTQWRGGQAPWSPQV